MTTMRSSRATSGRPISSLAAINKMRFFRKNKYDWIVLTEGVDDGLDSRFCSYFLEKCYPATKAKIVPHGGKETLKTYIKEIEFNESYPILILRDRDFDFKRGKFHKLEKVILTYGYSVENDLINSNAINKVICDACLPSSDNKKLILNELKEASRLFEDSFKDPIYFDYTLYKANSSFFVRTGKHGGVLEEDKSHKPVINVHKLNDMRLSKISEGYALNLPKRRHLKTSIDCYGHLYAAYWFMMVIYILKTYFSKSQIGHNIIFNMLITEFINNQSLPIWNHYRDQFNRAGYR